MIQHLTEIVEEARKRGKKRLAVAYGQDSHTLEAVYEAYKEGLVEPTLFGDKEVIKQVCQENGIDINAFNIVNEPKEVAEHKKVKGSSVAGDPDCLLFPNLESANVFFKSVSHLCGGELAAMVMGTKVPCVLTSRGDTSKTKLFSIALACLAVKK